MVKSAIRIYARIRPTKKATGLFEVGETEDGTSSTMAFTIPRSEASGFVNNKKELYSFRFNRVFGMSAKQDAVFEAVAHDVIDNCLEGYNGTIFAYGQTGSGKTFTITGGAERYADRGIIPRALSYIFQQYQKSPGTIFTTHISYMEIYNESGYDLLDPKHEACQLEDLQKVTLLEDGDGNIHLKNLSMHQSTNEEEALNLLFMGDTNRMIAETPMNMASTRSHCIFTVHISSREPGSDTILKAKLHLVDLAGSERVGKSGVGGTQLTEAKYINLSLHFLEQVIVALSEKSRTHIPYRNSMMTSVLRDSLGGNCMTTMIATCSVEKKNIDETISTCRFAQRVALVKNEATLNEELDPKLMVARLRQQVQDLREELVMATGEERTEELTQEERDQCHELVQAYIGDSNPEARLLVGGDMRKIQLCFQLMKVELLKRHDSSYCGKLLTSDQPQEDEQEVRDDQESECGGGEREIEGEGGRTDDEQAKGVASSAEFLRLRDLLKQRDDEISVLLKILKQERRRATEAEACLVDAGIQPRKRSPIIGQTSPIHLSNGMTIGIPTVLPPSVTSSGSMDAPGGERDGGGIESRAGGAGRRGGTQGRTGGVRLTKAELSRARQEAFDSFRRNHRENRAIDKHKKTLKAKYTEAKALGEQVNASRVVINRVKSQIEQHRMSQGIQGLTEGPAATGPDSKEEELRGELEAEKKNFKKLYDHLRGLKSEIEHVQHLLEKAKVQLQKDFEEWWTEQTGGDDDNKAILTSQRTPPLFTSSSSPSSSPIQPPLSTSRSSSAHRRSSRHRPKPIPIAAQFPGDPIADKMVATIGSRERARVPTSGRLSQKGVLLDSRGSSSLSSQTADLTLPFTPPPSSSSYLTLPPSSSSSSSPSKPNSKSGTPSSHSLSSSHGGSWGHHLTPGSRDEGSRTKRQPLPKVGQVLAAETLISGSGQGLAPPQSLFDTRKSQKGSSASVAGSSIPLTGDSKADADIIAFYKARQKLIQKSASQRKS